MARDHELDYRRTVADLTELARNCPHVTHDWVLQVASMDHYDMRRRLIRSNDWHGHFAHSLDSIPEIRNLPGAGIDGCRSHKEVRAIVLQLVEGLANLKAARSEKADALDSATAKCLQLQAELGKAEARIAALEAEAAMDRWHLFLVTDGSRIALVSALSASELKAADLATAVACDDLLLDHSTTTARYLGISHEGDVCELLVSD